MLSTTSGRGLLGVALTAAFSLAAPQVSSGQPTQPPSHVYVDEDYDFKVSSPQGWHRSNPASLSVPGEVARVWTPDDTSTISIFLQKSGSAMHPRTLLESSAGALKQLGCTLEAQEVRPVGGMQAMWLIGTGRGTGAALTGKGDVPTSQHWVAIPRAQDVLVLLLNAPASEFQSAEAVFNVMLGTLAVGGVQTPEQRAPNPASLPAAAANLDFEGASQDAGVPAGWDRADANPPTGGEGYEVTLDRDQAHGGSASGRIRRLSQSEHSFGTLTQSISAEGFRGGKVRLSGWLKTKDVKGGFSGLWMRIDGGAKHEFDNMHDRGPRGTTDWKKFKITLKVPQEASAIAFGALLAEDGTVWVDDLVLESL